MNPARVFLPLACVAMMAAAPPTLPTPLNLLENPTSFTGPVAIQTFAEGTFFYQAFESTQMEIPAKMKQVVPQLMKALAACGLPSFGPLHVVYHGISPDPAKPFPVEVGVLLPADAQVPAGCKVRKLPPFTCATTVFTGPLPEIGKAYGALYPALKANGKIPLPESRQMILFYEGETSTNNMLLIQIGIR